MTDATGAHAGLRLRAIDRGSSARPLMRALLFAVLLAVPLFLRLGAAPLFDVDEGAFSEATREMVESGDYAVTTLNGAPRYDKPILVYWLQAASVRLFGLGSGSLRLPSALCGWLWALAVAHFAWRRWGEAAAWASGLIAATCLGVLAIGRASTADALLNLWLALAVLSAWRAYESPEHWRGAMWRMWACIGLGLLTKGPIGWLVPAATVSLYALLSRRWREGARLLLAPGGIALAAVIAVPWYVLAYQRQGWDFIEGFFVRHNLARYTTVLEGHAGSGLYYLLLLPVLLLPWSVLLPSAVAQVRRTLAEPLVRWLLLWLGFVLVFFSASGTKLPHYVLYGATPCFLLLGRALAEAGRGARAACWTGLGLLTLLAAGLPAAMPWLATRTRDPLYRALLGGAGEVPALALQAAAAAVAIGLVLLLLWRGVPALPRLAVGGLAVATLLSAGIAPWLGEVLQGPVRQAAQIARERPEPAVQWGVHWPSFSVYRERSTPKHPLDEPLPPGTLGLTRADRLPADPSLEVLMASRGVVLVRQRP